MIVISSRQRIIITSSAVDHQPSFQTSWLGSCNSRRTFLALHSLQDTRIHTVFVYDVKACGKGEAKPDALFRFLFTTKCSDISHEQGYRNTFGSNLEPRNEIHYNYEWQCQILLSSCQAAAAVQMEWQNMTQTCKPYAKCLAWRARWDTATFCCFLL